MKLKTSFFNTSVLKKDITRFAPLWGLYTVFMLLFLFLVWGENATPAQFARDADLIMALMGAVNCCYAGLAALLLFGDLFKARLCYAIHALPMRREGWFLTHLAAGMLFCLIPNALGAVIAGAMLGQYAFLAYVWLALMLLQYLCFFGIGTFSMLCAGNGLGALAIYSLINGLSVLLLWLVKCFYEPVLFGITIAGEPLLRLSPVVGFCSQNYLDISSSYEAPVFVFHGFRGESWLQVGLSAVAGVALLVAALFIYRKRKLESAGDFISFRPASPVFLVLYSLVAAAILYAMADSINEGLGTIFLLIGLAIGWFTGLMLLQKRVNVFRLKTLAGFGVLVFAFYLSVSLAWLDPLGITRYVPDADQVQKVQVAPYTSDYYYGQNATVVTDPAHIEKITQIHQDLVDARIEDKSKMVFRLCYTMKTGVQVERTYYLDAQSENGQWLKSMYSSLEVVLGGSVPERLAQTARYIEIHSYWDKFNSQEGRYPVRDNFELKNEDFAGLIDAIVMDCKAGNMAQIWDYHSNEDQIATLGVEFGSGNYREVQVWESCEYTVNYLQHMADKYLEKQE